MKKVLCIFISLVLITSACNKEEAITTVLAPEIILVDYNGQYYVTQGEKLTITPEYKCADDATFSWLIDGKEVGNDRFLIFSAEEIGETVITLIVRNEGGEDKEEIKVMVEGEGTADFSKIFEYLPAPGQFINESNTAFATMEEAVAGAEKRLRSNSYVSLGGFGGYIVAGFDHRVKNVEGYDFGIYGNSFEGSSEPGVVWVMQDENGDGKPNDTWYELKGSETGKEETIQDYEVTYFRPEAPQMPVKWKDNQGNEGEVDYLQFHTQDYYYPAWVKEDSYKLSGTCLKARNHQDETTGNWTQPAYEWGYVDNYSSVDLLKKTGAMKGNANMFDIDNAIDKDGNAVKLEHIHFVKVQNAVNSKSGWLGELSVEVLGFFDYSLIK